MVPKHWCATRYHRLVPAGGHGRQGHQADRYGLGILRGSAAGRQQCAHLLHVPDIRRHDPLRTEPGSQEHPMSTTLDQPINARRLLPPLAAVTDRLAPFAEPLLRFATGALLLPHGLQKLTRGTAGLAALLDRQGMTPGVLWANAIMVTELVGGALIALGLLTRPAAFAAFCFLATAVWYHSSFGYFWTERGFEYPLLWAVACLFFVLRGGGRLSLDRALGWEF
jgi:putative oxidoreductase